MIKASLKYMPHSSLNPDPVGTISLGLSSYPLLRQGEIFDGFFVVAAVQCWFVSLCKWVHTPINASIMQFSHNK
jgi:hypothetical protein